MRKNSTDKADSGIKDELEKESRERLMDPQKIKVEAAAHIKKMRGHRAKLTNY